MKILRIELQNINSLKSENPIVIDFEKEPFNGAGLFGITGTTGAGKTTILDAITIALYNKVPRFNESHYQANVVDVVSRGAGFATSRVWFETNGVRYEAFWSIRLKSKNGSKLDRPKEEFQLSNLNTSEIISTQKSDYLQQIKVITKLEYRQFLRSVLLAQGEFAAFLSANRNEKGLLLEQLTGLDMYRKINDAVNARIVQEEKELAKIRGGLNEADLLSDEVKVSNVSKKAQLANDVLQIQAQRASMETILQWFQKEEDLLKLGLVLQSDKMAFEDEKESNRKKLEELQLHRLAEPFLPLLKEWERLEIEKSTFDAVLPNLRERLAQLTEDRKNHSTKVAESLIKVDEAAQLEKTWQPMLDDVTTLDTQIQHLDAQICELLDKVTAETRQRELDQTDFIKVRKDASNLQIEKDAVDKYLSEEVAVLEMETKLIDWSQKLSTRDTLNKSVIECDQTIELNRTSLESASALNVEIAEKISVLMPLITSVNERIGQLSLDISQNPTNLLIAKKNELTERKLLLAKLSAFSVEASGLLERRKILQKSIFELEGQLTQSNQSLQTSLKWLETAVKNRETAETIYRLKSKVVNLDAERAELKVGQACPLCGSTHHPYVENYILPELSDCLRDLEVCRQEEMNAQSSFTEHSVQNATLKANLETGKGELSKLDKDLEDTKALFQSQTTEFELSEKQQIEDCLTAVNKSLNQVDNQINTTSGWIQARADLQKQLDKNQQQLQQKELALASAIRTIEDTTTLIDNAKAQKSANSTALMEMEFNFGGELGLYNLPLPAVNETSTFINSIQKRIVDYHERQHRLQKLVLELQSLNDQAHVLSDKMDASQKRMVDFQAKEVSMKEDLSKLTLARTTILPLNISVDSKRKALSALVQTAQKESEASKELLQELEKNITAATTEINGLCKSIEHNVKAVTRLILDFQAKLVGTQWQSREDVQGILLSESALAVYEQLERSQREHEVALKTREKSHGEQVTALQTSKNFDQSKEEASVLRSELEDKIRIHQETIGQLSESLRKDDEIRSRNRKICLEMDAQKLVIQKWTKLYSLLGGTKESFNTYVQRLTLKQLIRQANIHLQKLNNRYSLYMDKEYNVGDELQFGLTDHFQTDEKRFVETSSGGEKFMISLALALGLSDIASRNVRIGSLFIDEGFGSLDSATLETVISTLETLQSQGKMIGVISHVDSLKERIPTQILVKKKSGGVSTVEIIG